MIKIGLYVNFVKCDLKQHKWIHKLMAKIVFSLGIQEKTTKLTIFDNISYCWEKKKKKGKKKVLSLSTSSSKTLL